MSELVALPKPPVRPLRTLDRIHAGMRARQVAERRFRRLALAAVLVGIAFLVLLFSSIVSTGYSAFVQTHIRLDIALPPVPAGSDAHARTQALERADYEGLIRARLLGMFPEVTERSDRLALYALVSRAAAFDVRDRVLAEPALAGRSVSIWLPADDAVDMLIKNHVSRHAPQAQRHLSDQQLRWLDALRAEGRLERRFNTAFFTRSDSRDPEVAGVFGGLLGSFFTLSVTLALAFPLGVSAAVYLEEFAPRNRWTDLIEVNINNLAAVPSITYGLLGLAVFINIFGLPRSSPVVGGLVLALMTLPTIIIAGRAALKSVPPSIREAALSIGASPMQTVIYHVLPLAMPGMLTGTIIGMSLALGETAPLLMIGMVAFIADPPGGIFDPAALLPVQIFLWADSFERAYVERTSAAIIVLLAFLTTMNAAAVLLRRRFERRW
jgi:phosphate transport system permease protein